jgi:putative acetyltransferase
MQVRRASPDDAADLVGVLETVAREGAYLGTEWPFDVGARVARMRAGLESGEDRHWLLEERGALVGMAGLHPGSAAGVLTFGMAVLAAARGRGGGRLLLETVVEQARLAGAHKLELEVWPDNGRAIALYASSGFEVEGVRRDHYRRRDGSLRSALLMARPLAP